MKTEELFSSLLFHRASKEDLLEIIKLLVEDELGKTRELLEPAAIKFDEAAFQKIDTIPITASW